MEQEIFGHMPDGRAVERVRLSGGGLTAHVLSFGAVLQDLRFDGHALPLVLGFETFTDYLAHASWHFGATAGRCANRIAGAAFALGGAMHRLNPNFLGKHHLHGGSEGTGTRLWRFADVTPDSATLALDLADGEMGYPGAMHATVRYALKPGGILDIRMMATADRPTVCNLAHHSYWNLSGAPDILGHRLKIAAEHYLPVDAELVPTGEIAPVAGTPFDFRTGVRLGEVCARAAIDHNFCLARARGPLRQVAELSGGGLTMTLRTTEPGLQVFDAAPLAVAACGLDGRHLGAHAGIALEPQLWPDAIHHPDWAQPVLRPGETYDQNTQFVFARRPE